MRSKLNQTVKLDSFRFGSTNRTHKKVLFSISLDDGGPNTIVLGFRYDQDDLLFRLCSIYKNVGYGAI